METTKTEIYLDEDFSNLFEKFKARRAEKKAGKSIGTKAGSSSSESGTKEPIDYTAKVQKAQAGVAATKGLLGSLGLLKEQPAPVQAGVGATSPLPTPDSEGMSTTTKVLIGVGAVAVLGGIIYFATRK